MPGVISKPGGRMTHTLEYINFEIEDLSKPLPHSGNGLMCYLIRTVQGRVLPSGHIILFFGSTNQAKSLMIQSKLFNLTRPALPVPLTNAAVPRGYLPFCFGTDFGLILRPKSIAYTDFNASSARATSALIFICSTQLPRFSPLLVSPVASSTKARTKRLTIPNGTLLWTDPYPRSTFLMVFVPTIDKFWFALGEDASCGFHVHISLSSGSYTDVQLRSMAKAIDFWEPAAARCAPPSRQDQVQRFCMSNISGTRAAAPLTRFGPLRGLGYGFDYIDNFSRQFVVEYVCLDKYRVWNLNPADLEARQLESGCFPFHNS
ncbi:uncharacterized protein A1O9_06575 [Exophiala aquamarina CBS 119918]|uniref:Uncharacterized protein n=1 Tax=Exophiala aquamarina CBS 119918 TaxID=1182545 RepID=A0A072PEU1_9EURO|nr:uncharacterized protein A1O9_06575 [Exophiala aquamarina CBS 119918]KEF58649.1 hypothetical protein A1O9_06575 [Exophiala aquamarina CBS 119918]